MWRFRAWFSNQLENKVCHQRKLAKSSKDNLIRFCLILPLVALLSSISILRTDGFSPGVIKCPLNKEVKDEISEELVAILKQPFFYLAKGRQSFVFESQDGKYVLKFFNAKYLKMPWYAFLCKKRESVKRAKRQTFYQSGYRIAHNEFGEEILYLHMSKGDGFPSVTLLDKASRIFTIDLNRTPFVLQRKGVLFYEYLDEVYQSKKEEGLYIEIDRFLSAVSQRIQKKISDGDSDVEHNWGVVDGRLFHLDPGRLFYNDHLNQKEEFNRATRKFCKWLKLRSSDAEAYCKSRIEEYLLRAR